MSRLGFWNKVLVQWLFFRVCRIMDDACSKQVGWGIIVPVVPLTGWHSDYLPRCYTMIAIYRKRGY